MQCRHCYAVFQQFLEHITCNTPATTIPNMLGIGATALVLQQNRLRWYGHVLSKEDDDCVKKCMEYEVEGHRP